MSNFRLISTWALVFTIAAAAGARAGTDSKVHSLGDIWKRLTGQVLLGVPTDKVYLAVCNRTTDDQIGIEVYYPPQGNSKSVRLTSASAQRFSVHGKCEIVPIDPSKLTQGLPTMVTINMYNSAGTVSESSALRIATGLNEIDYATQSFCQHEFVAPSDALHPDVPNTSFKCVVTK